MNAIFGYPQKFLLARVNRLEIRTTKNEGRQKNKKAVSVLYMELGYSFCGLNRVWGDKICVV